MMAVDIAVKDEKLIPGNPVSLFEGNYSRNFPIRGWDVAQDGQRFLMIQRDPDRVRAREDAFFGREVNIVLNWSEELKRLVPTAD